MLYVLSVLSVCYSIETNSNLHSFIQYAMHITTVNVIKLANFLCIWCVTVNFLCICCVNVNVNVEVYSLKSPRVQQTLQLNYC